jgi:hypothetical protein
VKHNELLEDTVKNIPAPHDYPDELIKRTTRFRNQNDVTQFKEIAERYCTLLEAVPEDNSIWTQQVLVTLSRLYALAHDLPDIELPDDAPDISDSINVTIAERKKVSDRVKSILGTQVAYWAYIDPTEPSESSDEPVFGNLADDLADIYRDIKPGLRAWATGDDRYLTSIIIAWKFPLFGSHWGVHAVSALRALHPLVYLKEMQDEHKT